VARIHTSFTFRSRIQAALGSGLAGSQPTDVQNSTAVSSAESTYPLRWRTKVRDPPPNRVYEDAGDTSPSLGSIDARRITTMLTRVPWNLATQNSMRSFQVALSTIMASPASVGGRGPGSELELKIVRQPLEIGHREECDLDRYVRHSP